MSNLPLQERDRRPFDNSIFTLVGGTTISDRAAIVRAHCREGCEVELRRDDDGGSCVGVWLPCPMFKGLLKGWKKIGEVPPETRDALLPSADIGSKVVAVGTVRTVYAPVGREEAVVTVQVNSPRH